MNVGEAHDLIRPCFEFVSSPATWCDLGCGDGLFSEAIASALPDGSVVHAIDKLPQLLKSAKRRNTIRFHQLDFTQDPLPFKDVDGILMANSLHFVEDKSVLLGRLHAVLKKNGIVVIVEYEMESANPWVPYPLGYHPLKILLETTGYSNIRKVGERRSVYDNRTMYACMGLKL